MRIRFVRADIDEDYEKIFDFEKRIFRKSDRFWQSTYKSWGKTGRLEVWWVLNGQTYVGYAMFYRDLDAFWKKDRGRNDKRYLYIGSTAILPEYQGRGIGKKIKMWQIRYAKKHGIKKIQTCCRISNLRMIGINKKYGFKEKATEEGYYEKPAEDALVLEYTV